MKTRIAFIDQCGDRSSGAQQSLMLLLRGLPAWIEPVVILFSDGAYAATLRNQGHTVVIHTVNPRFSRANRFQTMTWADPTVFREIFRLVKVIRKLSPQLVHTNTVKAHLLGIPAATLCGIPSIMHLRDSLGGVSRYLLTAFGRALATEVIAVSRRVDQWYSIPSTRVIYNPFERLEELTEVSRGALRSRCGLQGNAAVLGMVGPIHRNKGHERFIRIIANLQKDIEVFGLIIGDSRFSDVDEIPKLKVIAERLGILERLIFMPWLDDVREGYAALDLICNCSTNEPFGRTILEASSLGVACCMFDDCGASEVLVDRVSASISPAHDEVAFTARILELLNNRSLLTAVGAQAKKAAEALTVDKHVSQIEDIYRRLLLRTHRKPLSEAIGYLQSKCGLKR